MRIEPILPYQVMRLSEVTEPMLILPLGQDDTKESDTDIDVAEILGIGVEFDMMG